MTNQELFDTVVTHLRTQGPCVDETGNPVCQYRGANNTKCAAGCLIPDEDYSPSFEGSLVSNLDFFLDRFTENMSLLANLQSIHDSGDVENWEMLFERAAGRYGLDYV